MKAIYLLFVILILSLSFSVKAQNQFAIYDYWYVMEQNHVLSIQALDKNTEITQEQMSFALNPNKPLSRALLSSDRHWLAYTAGFGGRYDIFLVNLETEQQQIILADIFQEDDSLSLGERIQVIEWSPTNSSLLIRIWNPDNLDGREFYVYDVFSGLLHQLEVPERTSIDKVNWSNDGHLLIIKTVCVQGIGCETVPAIWDANSLTEITTFSGNFSLHASDGICELRWSPNERYIAYMAYCDGSAVGIEKETYIYDTVADMSHTVTNFTLGITLENNYFAMYSLRWADNDTLLIGAIYNNESGFHTDTLTYEASTNVLSTLFSVGVEDWELSPDGQRIAYRVFTATDYRSRDYSTRFSSITDLSLFNEQMAVGCNFMWSADSRWLAYTHHTSSCRDATQQFRFFNAESSESYTIVAPMAETIIPLGWVQRDTISSLSLLDSTSLPVTGFDPLENGDTLDLAQITALPLKFRANSNPATIGSVKFELSGSATASFTDDTAPYELDWTPVVGSYTLSATPYSGAGGTGNPGTPFIVNFSVVNSLGISSVSLINPANNTPISGFDPITEASVLDLRTMTTSPLNIIAAPNMASVGSVKFDLNGTVQIDNAAPYEFGNWTPSIGEYTLTVTPYSGSDGSGAAGTAHTVNFSVTQSLSISGFSLIDVTTGLPIPGYDPLVPNANNQVEIDSSTLPNRKFIIRANTVPSTVGSVRFTRTRYSPTGEAVTQEAWQEIDNTSSYEYSFPDSGWFTISARAFSQTNATGAAGSAYGVHIRIYDSTNALMPSPTELYWYEINIGGRNGSLVGYSPVEAWSELLHASASNGDYVHTTSLNAELSFAFYGRGFALKRQVANSFGNIRVCVDGVCQTVSNYSATNTLQVPFWVDNLNHGLHQVVITNLEAKAFRPDAIFVYGDYVNYSAGSYEAETFGVHYYGSWNNGNSATASGGIRRNISSHYGEYAFSFTGQQLSLVRHIAASGTYSNMEVCIDGTCQTVSNTSGTNLPAGDLRRVNFGPYTEGTHIVTVRSLGTLPINLDRIDVYNDAEEILQVSTSGYEEDHPYLNYSGTWTLNAYASASGDAAMATTSLGSSLSFDFTGTSFVYYRQLGANFANAEICVYEYDSSGTLGLSPVDCSIVTNTGSGYIQPYYVTIPGNGNSNKHYRAVLSHVGTTGQALTLDSVQILGAIDSNLVFQAQAAYYQEDAAGINYFGTWTNQTALSTDLGNSRLLNASNSSLRFFFEGTGLSWYHVYGASYNATTDTFSRNTSDIEICIDGECQVITGYVELTGGGRQWQLPMYIGDLPEGVHEVFVRTLQASNYYVDGFHVHFNEGAQVLNNTTQAYQVNANLELVRDGNNLPVSPVSWLANNDTNGSDTTYVRLFRFGYFDANGQPSHSAWMSHYNTNNSSQDSIWTPFNSGNALSFDFQGSGFTIYRLTAVNTNSYPMSDYQICWKENLNSSDPNYVAPPVTPATAFACQTVANNQSTTWNNPYTLMNFDPTGQTTYTVSIYNVNNLDRINVDAIQILPPVNTATILEAGRLYQEDGSYREIAGTGSGAAGSGLFTFTGGWMATRTSQVAANGDYYRQSNHLHDTVYFAFNGTGITLYLLNHALSADVEVCIDAVINPGNCRIVQGYTGTSEIVWQAPYLIDGLSSDLHYVSVRALDTNDIYFDAVHVHNETAPQALTPNTTPYEIAALTTTTSNLLESTQISSSANFTLSTVVWNMALNASASDGDYLFAQDNNASIGFQVANAVSFDLLRRSATNYADMRVCLLPAITGAGWDAQGCTVVDNSQTALWQRSTTISGLSTATTYTVTITPVTTSPVLRLELDAVRVNGQ